MSWVLDYSESELAARLVLLSIANHADAEGLNAYPGQVQIAKEAHVSVRTVRRVTDELVAMRELCVLIHQGVEGLGGRTNYYVMSAFRAHLGVRSDCPHLGGKCGHPDLEVRTSATEVRTPVAAEPSLEPSNLNRGVADSDLVPLSRADHVAMLQRARADLRGE